VSRLIELDYTFMQRVSEAWTRFDEMEVPEVADMSNNGAVMELFQRYAKLKAETERAKDEMDEIKKGLIEHSSDKSLTAGDFKLTKGKPRVTYDYKKAATKSVIDLEQYRKQSEGTWTISVPKNPFL
jgi:hypothetical protein